MTTADRKNIYKEFSNSNGYFELKAEATDWHEANKIIFRYSIYKNEKLIYLGYSQISKDENPEETLTKNFLEYAERFGAI